MFVIVGLIFRMFLVRLGMIYVNSYGLEMGQGAVFSFGFDDCNFLHDGITLISIQNFKEIDRTSLESITIKKKDF